MCMVKLAERWFNLQLKNINPFVQPMTKGKYSPVGDSGTIPLASYKNNNRYN